MSLISLHIRATNSARRKYDEARVLGSYSGFGELMSLSRFTNHDVLSGLKTCAPLRTRCMKRGISFSAIKKAHVP